jgi:hypothetical protein
MQLVFMVENAPTTIMWWISPVQHGVNDELQSSDLNCHPNPNESLAVELQIADLYVIPLAPDTFPGPFRIPCR